MPKVACLYLDDSGARNPDHVVARELTYRDWFTLGGYLINEEDEGILRTEHAKFCEAWGIKYPLHSYDMRAQRKKFAWLGKLEERDRNKFMSDLSRMLLAIPVLGHACVIDRPGYNARYREKHGRQVWQLCQTAFSVVVERAAKHAIKNVRKLRVYAEEGDESADQKIREYYAFLRANGMPFDAGNMAKYAPLGQKELSGALYDLDFKAKSSPMVQIADLYTYPIARGGYDDEYGPYAQLRAAKKLIDGHLLPEEIPHLGIKYSCFELVEKEKAKNKKSRK
jgi:hypothetical protein